MAQIRLLTFNVNGVKTLFHYHPFSQMHQSMQKLLDYFNADIITFQELKIDKSAVGKWGGKVDGYYSFITVPISRRGYSGVGCWVREFPEGDPRRESLRVVKAEEGITGYLCVKNGSMKVRYMDDPTVGIGGYSDLGLLNEEEAIELDSQGRCVILELASGLVVACVYCPANSNGTEEGEIFRMKFLRVLFKRLRNLHDMGKRLILMGDINVCRDLIDSAESLEEKGIKVSSETLGSDIDTNYEKESIDFILDPNRPSRRLLNQQLVDSLIPDLAKNGILMDTTRHVQTRNRLKMYTVWNTLKNTRPANYGSRIDLILLSPSYKDRIKGADIMSDVGGSDHCPVYLDLVVQEVKDEGEKPSEVYKIPKFEARYRYNLLNHNILSMFAKNQPRKDTASPLSRQLVAQRSQSLTAGRVQKKGLPRASSSIESFFQKINNGGPSEGLPANISQCQPNASREEEASMCGEIKQNNKKRRNGAQNILENIFGEPPLCKHNEKAIIKTSKTPSNPGRRFWACARPRGAQNDPEASCGFFQWVK